MPLDVDEIMSSTQEEMLARRKVEEMNGKRGEVEDVKRHVLLGIRVCMEQHLNLMLERSGGFLKMGST